MTSTLPPLEFRAFDGRMPDGGRKMVTVARSTGAAGTAVLAPKEWLAMGASSFVTFLASCLLMGCGVVVHTGLANAPSLGGTSPETRVHDVIANGHDACERPMFPQGEVLRGQIPPCNAPEKLSRPATFVLSSATAEPSLPRLYWFGSCPAGLQPRTLGLERGLTAFPLSEPRRWVACDVPSDRALSP